MVPENKYKVNSAKIVYDTLDGEVIIINFETGVYYSLNPAGKEVWKGIERNLAFSELVEILDRNFSGSIDEIEEDTAQLLSDLEKDELILLDGTAEKKSEITPAENGKEKEKYLKPAFRKYTDMKEMLLLDPIHEVDETGWPATKNPPDNKS